MLPCFLSFALLWNPLFLPWQLLTLGISPCFQQGEKVYTFPALIWSYFFPPDQILKPFVQLQVVSLKSADLCNVSISPFQGTACQSGTFVFHCSVFPPSPTSMHCPIWSRLLVLIHYQMLCYRQHTKFPAFIEFFLVLWQKEFLWIQTDLDCNRNKIMHIFSLLMY